MNIREKTIQEKNIYNGKIIDVVVQKVELINGKQSTREIVRHPGGVGILAYIDPETILMVEQFRKPIDKCILEIPAGKLEKGEEPIECAKRELEEETGYRANKMKFLGKIVTSPGFSDEYIYLYKAEGLCKGQLNPDEDEFLNVYKININDLKNMIKEGKIQDSKTINALMYECL